MTVARVQSGFDTYLAVDRPAANFQRSNLTYLNFADYSALLYLSAPIPRGATVLEAHLTIVQYGDLAGTNTVRLRRVTSPWSAGQVNWNNKPTETTAGESAVTKTNSPGLTSWTFDVTAHMQMVADGAAWYGWGLHTDTNSNVRFRSLDATGYRPLLTITWSDAPDAPRTLSPSGGVLSIPSPLLRFDYTDVSGSTTLASVQVQVDPAANWGAPAFDSGEVASSLPQLDLAATTYPGLANDATTYWRCRVKDAAGLWSGWSDAASFTRTPKGAIAFVVPAAAPDNVVTDFTPPIQWTFTGATQKAWRLQVCRPSAPDVFLHDSGVRTSTETVYTLPSGVLTRDETYRVVLTVWDDVARLSTPTDPPWVQASADFAFDYDAATGPADNLQGTADPDTPPVVNLTWDRAIGAPDTWTIFRNNEVVLTVPGVDLATTGTSYAWSDYGAVPGASNTYIVVAVVAGKQGAGAPSVTVSTQDVSGIWLLDPEDGVTAKLGGLGVDGIQYGEESATYLPIGSESVVRITTGLRGLEGRINGTIRRTEDGRSAADHESALLSMKARPAGTYRLVFGGRNIPVLLGNVTASPSPDTFPTEVTLQAGFDFWQNGELPFEAQL